MERLPDGTAIFLPDEALKTITDMKVAGDKIKYRMRIKMEPSKWVYSYGFAK